VTYSTNKVPISLELYVVFVIMAEPSSPPREPVDQESHIQQAIHAIRESGTRPNGHPILSIRHAATTFGVPRSTLTDRFNGKLTHREAHVDEQNLTVVQEEVLVEWIKVMGQRGLPLTPSAVSDHAYKIMGAPVGKSWGQQFMKQHPDLKVRWTTGLEECCTCSLNPTVVA
jgi:hypothetical protein